MNSVGALLKSERERQNRDVGELAEQLCLTQRYLRAIEQDDLNSLPGTFFYKSFVKQYAALLGVDETLLQPGLDALTGNLEPALPGGDSKYAKRGLEPPPLRDLDPIVRDGNRRYIPDSRIGVPLAALVGMVLATSGFYAWYNRVPQPRPAPVSRVETPAPPALDPASGGGTRAQPAPEPAPSEPVTAPVKAESSAPVLNVRTGPGADGVNHVELNLSATETTWLSITSDGKQIFSGVLEPSQTKTLTGLEVAKIKVGNAGGLEVMWNGKPIGPIGPHGQVRVVLFTPDNFQILMPNQAL